ncbi:MAG: DMT family transporter [Alphaproteobacteria bacterium]|nr:DMT family transporter [Alphaproteobacteria bacterium]MCB9928669.1 DMT family transporter [Alphaproteobacteria bacterium]
MSLPPTVAGVLLFTAGLSFIALADAMAKVLGQSMPSPQVVWLYLCCVLIVLALYFGVTRQNVRKLAKTNRPWLQVARGLCILGSLTFIFAALRFLPLAEATVINFTGPLFMVALAGPILGEKVGWRRWVAVLVGLAGALIVVRPGSAVFQWAALLPIGSAVFFALFQLITRKLAGQDSAMTTLLYTQVVAAVGAIPAAPFFWTPITLYQFGYVFLAGFVGLAAHICMFNAFRLADASLLAPINYTRIVASVLLGYLMFDQLPDAYTIAGGAVIVTSGLFVIWREAQVRRARPARAARP